MEDGGRIDPEILRMRTDAAGRVDANNHNRKSEGQQVSNKRRVGHPRGTVCKPCRRTRLDLGEKKSMLSIRGE